MCFLFITFIFKINIHFFWTLNYYMLNIIYKLTSFFTKVSLVIFLILYSLSLLSKYDISIISPLIAPFGLIFPTLYLFSILAFLILFIGKKFGYAFVYFIALVIGINTFTAYIQWNPQEQQGIKIMSWNVKNFDLYNWTKNKETEQKIYDFIKNENPDIICFQEFYSDQESFNHLRKLKKYGYRFQKMKTTFQMKDKKWGLAIVSKFPIQKYHTLDALNRFKNNNGMSCEIKTPEGIVEILNIHFKSIHLDYEDYALLEGKTNQMNAKYHQAKLIFKKIWSSYPQRAEQTDIVLNYIKQSNSKNILLCCDMNDIPCSYSYHKITKSYKDGFKSSGRGIAKTYDFIVPFRIDYIFHSDNVSFNSYEMKATKLSDHYPLIGHFKLSQ